MSKTQDSLNRQTCQGILSVSTQSPTKRRRYSLVTLPSGVPLSPLSLSPISPMFGGIAKFPLSHATVFP